MGDPRPMDETAIRTVLREPISPDTHHVFSEQDILNVVVEDSWAAVALRSQEVSREFLAAVHHRLVTAFPNGAFEVRAGREIYRGGEGFGERRHVIAILGGKGGVGKSTTALNLALTLTAMGVPTGLVDGDVNAPDIPHMLNVHPGDDPEGRLANWHLWSTKVTPPSRRMRPRLHYGLEVMSTGFVIPERRPPSPRSGVEMAALLRVLTFEVVWTADILLIDCPPGTGEDLWATVHDLPLSGALFVNTPQDLAQMDAARTLTLLREHAIPVIGAVENMAFLICPHCEQEISLFPTSTRLVDAGIAVLGRLPFDVGLSAAADRGLPLVLAGRPGRIAREFATIAGKLRTWLRERDDASAEAQTPPAQTPNNHLADRASPDD